VTDQYDEVDQGLYLRRLHDSFTIALEAADDTDGRAVHRYCQRARYAGTRGQWPPAVIVPLPNRGNDGNVVQETRAETPPDFSCGTRGECSAHARDGRRGHVAKPAGGIARVSAR